MQVSPYDRAPSVPASSSLVQLNYTPAPKPARWVPSRYNARAVGDDGRLILWNTFTGAISAFSAGDREAVLGALDWQGFSGPLGKVGEYLQKRGFLVRDDVDELERFRYLFAQQHWRTDTLEFILLASEDCNFRCVYCYEKFKRGTMAPEVRQGIRAAVLQRARYLRKMSLTWFGGEPLYGWEAVEELAPFFKDVATKHEIPYGSSMTTNGYLLTEERATKLLDWGCRQFQITLDGLAAEHDCKRVGRDGSPTYATILDNLRSLHQRKDASFGVSLRVNYDRDNVMQLAPFVEAISEDFAGDPRFQLRFYAVGRWGGDNDAELDTCGVGEQRATMSDLRRKAEDMNLWPEGGIKQYAEPGGQVCYAARPFNYIVGASGKLMKCTIALDDLDANVVGQIHPDGTMELDDERMSKWVRPYFETDSLCKSCYVLPGCQGAACPLSRITSNERTCCGAKSELKREMRYTLHQQDRARALAAVAAG
jgi:uncharacterized protein